MFEAGKKYIFSRTKYYDDALKYTNITEAEKHSTLVNVFDGYVFVGADENWRDLHKSGLTLTVWQN